MATSHQIRFHGVYGGGCFGGILTDTEDLNESGQRGEHRSSMDTEGGMSLAHVRGCGL